MWKPAGLAVLAAVLVLQLPLRATRCIRGPYLQNGVAGTVEIRWELDREGPSAVEYGTGAEAGKHVATAFRGRKHSLRLTNLRPGETYHYRIWRGDERVSDEYRFRAAPEAGKEFTFAVFGDFGAGTREQFQVARLLERQPAEFALLTGDMIYDRGEEERYDQRFFQPYAKSLRRMTFWPALGNHDVGDRGGAPMLSVFSVPQNGPAEVQPGRNYSFDYGNAHFVAFDSTASAAVLRRTIAPWLASDLAASKQRWKFVFMHHPPYSSGSHGEDARIRDIMVPVFTRAKVDVVFSGHDHCYERMKPRDGVTYVVSGNGGARLYPHKNPHEYEALFYNKKHGLTVVTVRGDQLNLRHVNVDREEVDHLELTK